MSITLGERPHSARKGIIVLFYSVFVLEIVFSYTETHAPATVLAMHLYKHISLMELNGIRLLAVMASLSIHTLGAPCHLNLCMECPQGL